MTTLISDESTNKIAEQKTEGTKEDVENNSSEMKKELATMIIDFNIVPTIIGFAIAVSFSDLMKTLSHFIIKLYFKAFMTNEVMTNTLSFLLVVLFCYVFGYVIFYKLIYTEDIAKQTIIKKAINEKKEEEIKKEIEQDVETSKVIQETAKINRQPVKNVVESFSWY
jgi:hypothetical protein